MWVRVVLVDPGGVPLATCVVGGSGPPDLRLVDALARAQLCLRRRGWRIRLPDVCAELAELLELAGLGREVGREAEGLEQPGVEEGVEPGDPVA